MNGEKIPLPIYIALGVFSIGSGLYATITTGQAIWGIVLGVLGVLQIYVSVLASAHVRAISDPDRPAVSEPETETQDDLLGDDERVFFLSFGSLCLGIGATTSLVEVPGLSPMVASLGMGFAQLLSPLGIPISESAAGAVMFAALGAVLLLMVVVEKFAPVEDVDEWERENL